MPPLVPAHPGWDIKAMEDIPDSGLIFIEKKGGERLPLLIVMIFQQVAQLLVCRQRMTMPGREPVHQGVHYYMDAVAFVPVMKAPMLINGPGQAVLTHQPNEYVEIGKLVEAALIFSLAVV